MKYTVTSETPTVRAVVHKGVINGRTVEFGEGLRLEDGVLSVDTADAVERDNTLPVTSAAVHTEIGNIEVLLAAL